MPSFYADSLLGRLEFHALEFPEQTAYRYLHDQGPADVLTFGGLAARVRTLAARLRQAVRPGERVLLLYPQGLEFVAGFLACLAAGAAAVPAYPPRRNRKADRIDAILADCAPAAVLTTAAVRAGMPGERLSGLSVLATDEVPLADAPAWDRDSVRPDAPAFLQYTSGSTGTPRGVVVTHANLAVNARQTAHNFDHHPWHAGDRASVMVSWLPIFHDMGLVGGVLQSLYVGFPSVLMSPTGFAQEPVRWLRAIADYRGTTAGAPNFAYDHCARTVTDEQKIGLDLGSLRVLYNGAEPVSGDTLDRFTAAFAQCGFRGRMFFPCYGMAETTLFVSGGPPGAEPSRLWVDAAALEAGRVEVTRSPGLNRPAMRPGGFTRLTH